MSTKMSAIIGLWTVGVVGSLLLSPMSTLFAGIAIGAILTAVALLIVVKWGLKDMIDSTMGDVKEMSDNVGGRE